MSTEKINWDWDEGAIETLREDLRKLPWTEDLVDAVIGLAKHGLRVGPSCIPEDYPRKLAGCYQFEIHNTTFFISDKPEPKDVGCVHVRLHYRKEGGALSSWGLSVPISHLRAFLKDFDEKGKPFLTKEMYEGLGFGGERREDDPTPQKEADKNCVVCAGYGWEHRSGAWALCGCVKKTLPNSETEPPTTPPLEMIRELQDKILFLLNDIMGGTPEGSFTFPDGDTWETKKRVELCPKHNQPLSECRKPTWHDQGRREFDASRVMHPYEGHSKCHDIRPVSTTNSGRQYWCESCGVYLQEKWKTCAKCEKRVLPEYEAEECPDCLQAKTEKHSCFGKPSCDLGTACPDYKEMQAEEAPGQTVSEPGHLVTVVRTPEVYGEAANDVLLDCGHYTTEWDSPVPAVGSKVRCIPCEERNALVNSGPGVSHAEPIPGTFQLRPDMGIQEAAGILRVMNDGRPPTELTEAILKKFPLLQGLDDAQLQHCEKGVWEAPFDTLDKAKRVLNDIIDGTVPPWIGVSTMSRMEQMIHRTYPELQKFRSGLHEAASFLLALSRIVRVRGKTEKDQFVVAAIEGRYPKLTGLTESELEREIRRSKEDAG